MRGTSQRRVEIYRMLKDKGSVQVPSLSEMFKVSTVTIRKDITLIETEVTFGDKQVLHAEEKCSIGAVATNLVENGDSIILYSGSAPLQIASYLEHKENVIIVTDSSKFGHVCLHKILEPSGVRKIVTDQNIPKDYHEGLQRLGINVIIVEI